MSARSVLSELRLRNIQVWIRNNERGDDNLGLSPDALIDDALRNRVRECKPEIIEALRKGATLVRAIEILGAQELVGEPLPSDTGFIFRCRRCGRSADSPIDGIRWLDTHNCSGARPCSHCRGGQYRCDCWSCKQAGVCAVCRGAGRIKPGG